MMRKPYVGITGFMKHEEVLSAPDTLPSSQERLFMVGVLASSKTLAGEQNKWPNRYPCVQKIASIFLPSHPMAFNLIHYNTDDQETLFEQLSRLTELGGPSFHGFQLNIAWPDPKTIERYRNAYTSDCLVLQVGGHAFNMVGHSPERLAKKIKNEYQSLIEYVLLDPSGGYGRQIDVELIGNYLDAIQSTGVDIGLGCAGGLSPDNISILEPLAKRHPDLSIDAEGRLRDLDDHLNLSIARDYLSKAFHLFGQ